LEKIELLPHHPIWRRGSVS